MVKNILFSSVVIVSFLIIRISYNNSPSHSIFEFIIRVILYDIEKGFSINFYDYPLDFNVLTIEIFSVFILLIYFVNFSQKIFMKIISFILVLFLWAKNLYLLDFTIDVNQYVMSSIPFLLISLGSVIFFVLKYLDKSNKEERN